MAFTEVPIQIKETRNKIDKDKKELALTPSEFFNYSAFNWWFVTLGFNVMFIMMHISNFPAESQTSDARSLYLFLILGINLPWTLSCIRNFIVVPVTSLSPDYDHPTNPYLEWFIIIYDTLINRDIFRNHIILQVFSILGFTTSEYFTLMLLDILNNNDTLASIMESVVQQGAAISLVFYLFLITIVIYATFGLTHFEKYLVLGWTTEDGEEQEKTCGSVIACFWHLLYNLPEEGNMHEYLGTVEPGSKDYLLRILFDTTFYVWVGILLLNVVTGLMVDTFGAVREEKQKREAIKKNYCFVCGFERDKYEDLGLDSTPFNHHVDHNEGEHAVWQYVYFKAYLKAKNPNRLSGIESYVQKEFNRGVFALAWVPNRTSFVIELEGKGKGKAQQRGGDEDGTK